MNPVIVGVWIDHTGARMATDRPGKQPQFQSIESDVEKRHRTFGQSGVPLPGHIGGSLESHYQNRREQELRRFYSSVATSLPECDAVLILGPGEARHELLKYVQELNISVVKTEAAPRLSNGQLLARMRKFTPSLAPR